MKILEGIMTTAITIVLICSGVSWLDTKYPHLTRGGVAVGERYVNTSDLNNPFLDKDTIMVVQVKDDYCLFDHTYSQKGDCDNNPECKHTLSEAEFLLNYTKVN